MAKRFDPARLFEPWKFKRDPKIHVYASDEAALDAVQARKKGLSFFSSTDGALRSEVDDWLDLASTRDLLVTLQVKRDRKRGDRTVNVFLSRPEELWRIPAFIALWDTAFADGRWSDGAETQMGLLLGYTKPQRKAWLAAQRQARPAWTSGTVYALLDADRRKTVEAVGRRCFGPTDAIEGMTLLYSRDPVKPNALALVPRGQTLARVGIDWSVLQRVFGTFERMKRSVIPKPVTKKLAPAISGALRSNVQFLGRSGWA